jgi:pimeloyl-ACP methyl ester carboxylesterase
MYLRGFDRRGAAASLNNASAAGFTLSGCWSDQADFAVAVLFDADDVYGHLYTSRYLPDFSLASVTLDFDLAWTGCQNPTSSKYPSVAWGSLSYIARSVAGGVVTETPGTVALPVTATTGGAQASCTYTVNGTPAAYDRVQLVYLGNVIFDQVVPVWTGSAAIVFSFWNYLGTGYTHTITIGTQTYTHVQLATDGSGDFATALANLINAAPDANATAAANNVTLTPKLNTAATVAVYKELLRTYKPSHIVIYGTSAGAILTAEVAARLKQLQLPLPAALGVFSGLGDFSRYGDSEAVYSLGGFSGHLDPPEPEPHDSEYVATTDPRDPVLSPIFSDMHGLPPTLFITSGRDMLLSGTVNLHRAYVNAGVDARLVVFDALPHAFWYDSALPEAIEANHMMADFFVQQLRK